MGATGHTKEASAEGVVVRHSRRCGQRQGETSCSCSPSFQAQVYSQRDRRPLRKTFATLAEAKAWRQEMQVEVRRGRIGAPSPISVAEAAREWLDLAERGVVRTRSGDQYKPSALRSYNASLRALLPEIGHLRLSAVTRNQLQDIVDRLVANGRAPSTVRNTLLPLRAIYRRALTREDVLTNPTLKLTLPAVRARRDRIARPDEAAALITAVPAQDRAIWATALYAGLRLGELRALNWTDIHLDNNLIDIQHAWDPIAGLIDPKSRSGKRRIPLTNTLRTHLLYHRLHKATAAPASPSATHKPNPSTPGPSPTAPAPPGKTPDSPPSAFTNAATPTPPT